MHNNNLKFFLRKIVNSFSKYPIIYNNGFNLQKVFDHFKINYVLDVGAYTGTYAMSLRRFGYKGKILSFEPVVSNHTKLVKNSIKDDKWTIHQRIALGSTRSKGKINISKKKDSSSILRVKNLHKILEPDSKIIGSENINIDTIDNIMDNYKNVKLKNSILKIDTQGYEYEVLLGSKKTLKNIRLIQIELSLESLYTKQKNSNLITKFLNKNNFRIWNIIPGFKDKEKSRLLQYDAIFYKNPK